MKKLMLLCTWLCAMSFVVAAPAHASNTRSWVSSSGSDSNACTQAAPCLTFAHAIGQTSSGGEIDCMSGGDFGAMTITFSITIDCGAGQVGVASNNGVAAITLNTSSSAVVVLRNLNINGFGANGYGIDTFAFPSGTLIVQHCLIHGFAGDGGIYFSPGSGRSTLQISDTSVFNNEYGITLYPGSGVIISATFNQVEITTNSQTGLTMEGSGIIAGTLRQSLVANNGNGGIYALASAVYFTVEESSIINNLSIAGIAADSSGANIEVGASTIGGNGTGIQGSAGSIFTFGNNQFSANGSNGSFTPGGPGLQ